MYNYKRYLQRVIRLVWTSTNNQTGSLSLHNVRVDLPIVRKVGLLGVKYERNSHQTDIACAAIAVVYRPACHRSAQRFAQRARDYSDS